MFEQGNTAKAERPPNIYEQHEQSVREYHEACRNYGRAAEEKQRASNQLEKVTQELSKHVQSSLSDPTCPQPSSGLVGAAPSRPY